MREPARKNGCDSQANPMNQTRNPRNRRLSPDVEALDARQMLSGNAIRGLAPVLPARLLAARPVATPGSRQLAALLVSSSDSSIRVPQPSIRQHPLRSRTFPPDARLNTLITPPNSSPIAQGIIDLTNQARAGANVPSLSASPALMTAAQLHSGDMARLNLMSHGLPGVPLASLTDRAAYVHYRYQRLGENIAYNQADAAGVVASWMSSPPHRENMLDPSFTQIGVGVSWNQLGEPYYTMMLGKPA